MAYLVDKETQEHLENIFGIVQDISNRFLSQRIAVECSAIRHQIKNILTGLEYATLSFIEDEQYKELYDSCQYLIILIQIESENSTSSDELNFYLDSISSKKHSYTLYASTIRFFKSTDENAYSSFNINYSKLIKLEGIKILFNSLYQELFFETKNSEDSNELEKQIKKITSYIDSNILEALNIFKLFSKKILISQLPGYILYDINKAECLEFYCTPITEKVYEILAEFFSIIETRYGKDYSAVCMFDIEQAYQDIIPKEIFIEFFSLKFKNRKPKKNISETKKNPKINKANKDILLDICQNLKLSPPPKMDRSLSHLGYTKSLDRPSSSPPENRKKSEDGIWEASLIKACKKITLQELMYCKNNGGFEASFSILEFYRLNNEPKSVLDKATSSPLAAMLFFISCERQNYENLCDNFPTIAMKNPIAANALFIRPSLHNKLSIKDLEKIAEKGVEFTILLLEQHIPLVHNIINQEGTTNIETFLYNISRYSAEHANLIEEFITAQSESEFHLSFSS